MAQQSLVQRVEQAVLLEDFLDAAEEYADELLGAESCHCIPNILSLVHKRERFMNARAMMVS